MRTVPIVAAAVCLVWGVLEASPFEGLDSAPGVYVTVDGYGITIRQSALDWDFHLPDGSKAEWKKGSGYGKAPHVEITCRVAGGYLPAKEAKAIWTIPRPAGMPKGLGRKQRKRWKQLGWPWTWGEESLFGRPVGIPIADALDMGLSAIAGGGVAGIRKSTKGTTFRVRMRFQVDPETAVAALLLARHCTAAD